MVSDRIHKTLAQKSKMHQIELKRLGQGQEDVPLSKNIILLEQKSQLVGINTLLMDPETPSEDFIFYFDRLVTMLVERSVSERLSSGLFTHASQGYLVHALRRGHGPGSD